MKHYFRSESGFTLIEIAIVLLIVGILLGYTVALFPVQQELKQYRQTEEEMSELIEHLVGFAQVNGRLPCPDTTAGGSTIDGLEDLNGLACQAYFAFYPARTMGIDGEYDAQGRLLDPWGQPYRYAVSASDAAAPNGTVGTIDFVAANELRAVGIANANPDLSICNGSNVLGNHLNCGAVTGGAVVVANVAAVIVSTGKDAGQIASNIQTENLDDIHIGTNDKVFISASRSDVTNAEYDDVVKWLSTNQLFSKMIEADQLP